MSQESNLHKGPHMNKESSVNSPAIYQAYPYPDDEIELSELFNRIWRRRLFIVSFVFMVVVFVSGFFALNMLVSAPEKRYSSIIQFSFPGAENGL